MCRQHFRMHKSQSMQRWSGGRTHPGRSPRIPCHLLWLACLTGARRVVVLGVAASNRSTKWSDPADRSYPSWPGDAGRACLSLLAHSPEDANETEMPFCAPPTDRIEGTVPVQIGGYSRADRSQRCSRRVTAVPTRERIDRRFGALGCLCPDVSATTQIKSRSGRRRCGSSGVIRAWRTACTGCRIPLTGMKRHRYRLASVH
jgi:hypothetical protein